MRELRIGVLGCARFAQRAMLPALVAQEGLRLVAVASRDADKAARVAEAFGCEGLAGYERLLERDDIDAVYLPLPTGLHEPWVVRALEAGKHLLVEKSFAVDLASAGRMVELARRSERLIVENFLFPHHTQTAWLQGRIASGEIGELRLLRACFAIPPLPREDFRYDPAAGGGALIDTGTYVVKAARLFLGEALEVRGASLRLDAESGVDIQGEILLRDARGRAAQLAFGFDHFYQCTGEFLGTRARLATDRLFTPPPGFHPTVRLETQDHQQIFTMAADDHLGNMWRAFAAAVRTPECYAQRWDELLGQAALLDAVREEAMR